MRKALIISLVLLLNGCDNTPTTPSAPPTIQVTWPVAGNIYFAGDGVRIKWDKSEEINRVSIILRRLDGPFGDFPEQGVLMFSAVSGNEILWREWDQTPVNVPTGTYTFRVESTEEILGNDHNNPPWIGGRIWDESEAFDLVRERR